MEPDLPQFEEAEQIFADCFSLEEGHNNYNVDEIYGKLYRYCLDREDFVRRCFDEQKTEDEVASIIHFLEEFFKNLGYYRLGVGNKVFWTPPDKS